MSKYKKNLFLVLILVAILSSIVYADAQKLKNETYSVASGSNPTKRYLNIKAGEHYIIRLRTIDGSRLIGKLRVRTYNNSKNIKVGYEF